MSRWYITGFCPECRSMTIFERKLMKDERTTIICRNCKTKIEYTVKFPILCSKLYK